MTGSFPRDRWVRAGLVATFVVLVAHALFYRFLCDDAFISFRYAHNLASGHGLVFNPGFERVEGYTSFLWVVALAAFDVCGFKPEHVAPVLSMLLTVALWGIVARAAWRLIPAGPWRFAVLLPAAWLAMTRSVAVWSTSGMETRLFEVLVVAGVFRSIDDVSARSSGDRRAWPAGSVCLALAALARPDGVLVAGAVMAVAAAVLATKQRLRWAEVAAHALVFSGIVGAHLVFRHTYYGEWVPNTYYAKVGGRAWWEMGAAYLGCFAIEYAVWLWIPFLIAGVKGFIGDERAETPLLLAAAIVPHAVYVAAIGGDHFEFRPVDLYFPFVYVLMGRGAAALATGPRARAAVETYAAVLAVGLVAIPWQSHRQFPTEYSPGFPGLGPETLRRRFLDPADDPVYRWPIISNLARTHRDLLRSMTSRLVGVRQEEHAMFLASVVPEGRRLGALRDAGVLPQDTHVAMDAVGAIPYYSGLRTLDRIGLTDAAVAKSTPTVRRTMAHDKHATFEYAAASGVDLWTDHPVNLLSRIGGDDLVSRLAAARASGAPVYFARTGEGEYLVARLPQGIERTAPRFPKLSFFAAADDAQYDRFLDAAIDARQEAVAASPSSRRARISLGAALAARGRDAEAMTVYRELAEANDAEAWRELGALLARRGAFDEAIVALRRALATEPSSESAIFTLGAALRATGDQRGVAECVRQLEAMGTDEGSVLAKRLARGAGPP